MATQNSIHFAPEQQVALQNKHTFGLPATAEYYSVIKSLEDLTSALTFSSSQNLPVFILGGGSNTIFMSDVKGLVLDIQIDGIEKVYEDDEAYTIFAGAGVHWHSFVAYCLAEGWYGLENLALIPGRVGASPIQNIGAYGVEVAEYIHAVHVYNRHNETVETLTPEQCQFGYRDSVFKHAAKSDYIIIGVSFRLPKRWSPRIDYGAIAEKLGDKPLSPDAIFETVIAIRQSKLPDPAEIGNAGSFFKNAIVSTETAEQLKTQFPEMPQYPQSGIIGDKQIKIPSGWLIDHLGLKGYQHGGVGIYEKQALVLVNLGSGTAEALEALIDHIQEEVELAYGIDLEIEPNLVDQVR